MFALSPGHWRGFEHHVAPPLVLVRRVSAGVYAVGRADHPTKIINSKQPQAFIQQNVSLLQQSRFVLSDDVGIAAGLGWELRRSDIFMFDEKGELEYGLSYPDAQGHYVSASEFPQWLLNARQQGNVSLLIKQSISEQKAASLPRRIAKSVTID